MRTKLVWVCVAWIFQGSVGLEFPGTPTTKRNIALSVQGVQLHGGESCPHGAPCSCNCHCNPGRVPPPPAPVPMAPVLPPHPMSLPAASNTFPPQENPEPFLAPAPLWKHPPAPKMPPLSGIGSYIGGPVIKPLKERPLEFNAKDFGGPPKAPWQTPPPPPPPLIKPPPMTPAPPYTKPPLPTTTTAHPTTSTVLHTTTFPWWYYTTSVHTFTLPSVVLEQVDASSLQQTKGFMQKREVVKHSPPAMIDARSRSFGNHSYTVQPGGQCACPSECDTTTHFKL